MPRRVNIRGRVMAALLMREIGRASNGQPLGSANLFVRAALVVAFMYLVLLSFTTLGVAGPVFISVLFLVAFFVPVLYQVMGRSLQERRRRNSDSPGVVLPTDGRRGKADREF